MRRVYAVVKSLYEQDVPVAACCETLGVSRSGYYAWLCGKPCARDKEDERLSLAVGEVFREHKRRYGARRIV